MMLKTIVGLGAVAAYYTVFRKHEISSKAISGASFLWANLIFLSTTGLYQQYYNYQKGNVNRIDLHKKAFYLRFAEAWQFFKDTKKPSIH
jgi:hypothetical protein